MDNIHTIRDGPITNDEPENYWLHQNASHKASKRTIITPNTYSMLSGRVDLLGLATESSEFSWQFASQKYLMMRRERNLFCFAIRRRSGYYVISCRRKPSRVEINIYISIALSTICIKILLSLFRRVLEIYYEAANN